MSLEYIQGRRHALSMFEGSLVDAAVIIERLEQNIQQQPCAKFAAGMQAGIDYVKAQMVKR